MDSDLFHLLKLFVENGPMTAKKIAYYDNVTKRTVENKIHELNDILNDTAHVSKGIKRYRLVINDYPAFLHLETQFLKGELDLNEPVKREAYILDQLLEYRDYLAMDDIADQMTISKKVISKDIQNIRNELKGYNGQIISTTGKGIKVIFKHDYNLVMAYRNLVVAHINKEQWVDISNSFMAQTKDLNLNQQVKKQILSNVISVWMIKRYHYSLKGMPNNFKKLWDNTPIVCELNDVFDQLINKLTFFEKEFILSPLNLYKNQNLDENIINKVFKQNFDTLMSSLKKGLLKYGLNPKIIYPKMKWHILFSINRALLKEKISEILPQDISEKYPIALEFGISLANTIDKKYKVHLDKDEINYFVIYFEMFLEDRSEDIIDQVNVAFVGAIRSSVKDFIENKLLQVFENLKIDTFHSVIDFKESKTKYLLIFSDHPFTFKNNQIINIGTAFREEALSIIVQVSVIEHLIDQGKCTMNVERLEAKDYFDATEKIINNRIKSGELDEEFKKNWIKRERYTNNIFSNGIAIPHAVDSSGKKRILLSVGIVQNKINFRNRRVKLIFLIGIPKTLNNTLIDITSRLYDLIGVISRNEVLYGNFLKYDNSKPFIQITEGV